MARQVGQIEVVVLLREDERLLSEDKRLLSEHEHLLSEGERLLSEHEHCSIGPRDVVSGRAVNLIGCSYLI